MVLFILTLGCSKKESKVEPLYDLLPHAQYGGHSGSVLPSTVSTYSGDFDSDDATMVEHATRSVPRSKPSMKERMKQAFRWSTTRSKTMTASQELKRIVDERIDQELSPYMVQMPTPRNEYERARFQHMVQREQHLQEHRRRVKCMQLKAQRVQRELASHNEDFLSERDETHSCPNIFMGRHEVPKESWMSNTSSLSSFSHTHHTLPSSPAASADDHRITTGGHPALLVHSMPDDDCDEAAAEARGAWLAEQQYEKQELERMIEVLQQRHLQIQKQMGSRQESRTSTSTHAPSSAWRSSQSQSMD